MDTVRILNQLLAIHGSSLPMYLMSARPHRQYGDERVWEALRNVMEDQQTMIDKLAEYVESHDGTPNHGEFPMDFTGMHDLSMDHILKTVIERQKCEIEWIEHFAGMIESDPTAKALAQEALGAAKAHVQSLEECQSAPA